MGSHKKKGSTFDPRIPTPIADYNVTGKLSPWQAKGNYYLHGTYDGKPSYRNENGLWFIWWYDPCWVISTEIGTVGTHYWRRCFENIVGDYTPEGAASETATVAAGPL